MFALGHALMRHSSTVQRTPPPPSIQTPRIENTPPAVNSSPSTFAPDSPQLPSSAGIPPTTVQFPGLAKTFKVTDQQAYIAQHDDLTLAMQRLHSQQPNFKAFIQAQLEEAFPEVRPLNAETLSFNRYRRDGDNETLASSEPLTKALGRMIQDIQANPNRLLHNERNIRTEFINRQTPTSNATPLSPQVRCSLSPGPSPLSTPQYCRNSGPHRAPPNATRKNWSHRRTSC